MPVVAAYLSSISARMSSATAADHASTDEERGRILSAIKEEAKEEEGYL
jgi:hypothetical protein